MQQDCGVLSHSILSVLWVWMLKACCEDELQEHPSEREPKKDRKMTIRVAPVYTRFKLGEVGGKPWKMISELDYVKRDVYRIIEETYHLQRGYIADLQSNLCEKPLEDSIPSAPTADGQSRVSNCHTSPGRMRSGPRFVTSSSLSWNGTFHYLM